MDSSGGICDCTVDTMFGGSDDWRRVNKDCGEKLVLADVSGVSVVADPGELSSSSSFADGPARGVVGSVVEESSSVAA